MNMMGRKSIRPHLSTIAARYIPQCDVDRRVLTKVVHHIYEKYVYARNNSIG